LTKIDEADWCDLECTVSEKARGKKRALNDDDEVPVPRNGAMDLDTDVGSSDEDEDGVVRLDGDHDNGRASRASSSSGGMSTDHELGGSISRSARMRATMTDDEDEGDGSDSMDDEEDGRSLSGGDHLSSFGDNRSDDELQEDNEAEQEIMNSVLRAFDESRAGAGGGGSRFVTASGGEAYLHAMARPAKTSNKKLSDQLSRGQPFTQSSFLSALNTSSAETAAKPSPLTAVDIHHQETLLKIEEAYAHLFSQWALELEEGFSVFLYGLGSKARILNRFAQDFLEKRRKGKGKAVVINGYMASLGVDEILYALEGIVTPQKKDADGQFEGRSKLGKSAAKLDERAKTLVEKLHSSTVVSTEQPIYLLVNNIDGVALRSYRAQAILSLLASQPQIRLIATVDHVKAALLFPSSISSTTSLSSRSRASHKPRTSGGRAGGGYNIVWHHVPTHQPYAAEVLASGTMSSLFPSSIFISNLLLVNGMDGQGGLAGASSESRAKAAWFVLASLTQKAKDLFVLLSERQISLCESLGIPLAQSKRTTSFDGEKTPATATLYSSLLSQARDRFLANNVNQFEALLREFRDHRIVLGCKNLPEGVDEDELDVEGNEEEVGQRSGEWIWIAIEREDLEGLVERLKGQ